MIECTTAYDKKKLVKPEDLIFRPSVYGFITKDNKLLVMQAKTTGKLTLPGGGIEKGELVADALKRETKEETSIEIRVGDLVGVEESFFYYDPWKEAWHGLLLFYSCEPVSSDIVDVENVAGTETGTEKPEWVEIESLSPEHFVPSIVSVYGKWVKRCWGIDKIEY